MNFLNFGEITQKAKEAFLRFPITLIWAIFGTFFVISILEFQQDLNDYNKETITLILGVSWLIGARFWAEQLTQKTKKIGVFCVSFLLIFAFYIHLPTNDSFDNPIYLIRFLLYLIAGHLFLMVAPFIGYWNKNAFWNYLKSVFIAIGRSLLFTIVLYLGLILALMAVKYLFDVDIKEERYFQIYVFCLGIVNTWTYLSDFPKNIRNQENINYNKALEVFVKYILIPLVILYLIILYAYGLKIVLEWNLPKGWVSYLVIALAFLGFSIQIMVNPIQKNIKSRVINKFHPWFYYALLPLLILLFIAVFKRISDYGFTEKRYFVLILAIWISLMALYLLFSKNKYLKVLPISIGIIALLSSVGFWGAFHVSKKSQVNQFNKVYSTVSNNKNIATNKSYKSLKSILTYLNKREQISLLNTIVAIDLEAVRKTSKFNNNQRTYFSTKYILDSLGIIMPKDEKNNYSNKYRSFSLDTNNFNIDIKDYSRLYKINFLSRNNNSESILNYSFKLIEENTKVVIQENNKTIHELNLKPLIKESEYNANNAKYPAKDLTFIIEKNNTRFKIIIEHLSVKIENNKTEIRSLKAYVLIKHHDL
ncbi:MAG: DUF4153 domain-containing protein [Oceanihabitans sp.]